MPNILHDMKMKMKGGELEQRQLVYKRHNLLPISMAEWVNNLKGRLDSVSCWGFIQKTAKTTTQQFWLKSLHQMYVVQKAGSYFYTQKDGFIIEFR